LEKLSKLKQKKNPFLVAVTPLEKEKFFNNLQKKIETQLSLKGKINNFLTEQEQQFIHQYSFLFFKPQIVIANINYQSNLDLSQNELTSVTTWILPFDPKKLVSDQEKKILFINEIIKMIMLRLKLGIFFTINESEITG
jgi:hypothetical protein